MKISATTIILLLMFLASGGCRSIRRIGESRQSIAARRLSGQGFKAMQGDRWDLAETLFTDALEVSGSDDRAHWGLAESLWQRDEHDAAITHMEQAVKLSAGDPKRVQRLGRMYLEVGRLHDAQLQSAAALAAARNNAEVWALRGDCLKASGQSDEALAAYHRALSIQPDYPDVQIQTAEIYNEQERHGRLLATLDRLHDNIGADAAPARSDILQGIAMRELGRSDEAIKCFTRASKKDPNDASPHLELAFLSLDSGDVENAKRSLSLALELQPDSLSEGSPWAERFRQHRSRLAVEPSNEAQLSELR